MRNAFLTTTVLLVAAAACDPGRATRPTGPSITVRVRDDAGAPVGRAPIVVTISPTERVSAETRRDGTAVIGVASAGSYQVTVIPGPRYVVAESRSKLVLVAPSGTGSVEFTLYRSGNSEFPTPEPPGY